MRDYRTAGLEPRWTALLALVEKPQRQPDITPEDIETVKSHGWSDEAIYDAITVCALFNFYNRWCDGAGVNAIPAEGHAASGKRLDKFGYAPPES